MLARDDHRCVVCGWRPKKLDPGIRELTCGHIIPRSISRDDSLENIQTECKPCNGAKGNTPPDKLPFALARTWRDPAPQRHGPAGCDLARRKLSNARRRQKKRAARKNLAAPAIRIRELLRSEMRSPEAPIELILSDRS